MTLTYFLPELGGAMQLMGIIRLLIDPENMLSSANVSFVMFITNKVPVGFSYLYLTSVRGCFNLISSNHGNAYHNFVTPQKVFLSQNSPFNRSLGLT